jgi:hypothetical protein
MSQEDAKALGAFLADDELEQLSAQLATFNIFRALKVEDAEIRHSDTLAWLLDPAESHGLGGVFLRRVLSDVLLESGADIEGLSAAQVELMDFSDVEVRRERRHIDVLVVDRKNEVAVLIENKVHGSESPGQLARYRLAVSKEFPPPFRVVPVFLTLEGEPATGGKTGEWVAYSHARLLRVLGRVINQRRGQMPEAVLTFLDHYTDTLQRLTMQDEALVDLCRRIYRRHKHAIKLIVQYGEVTAFRELASDIVAHDAGCEVLYNPLSAHLGHDFTDFSRGELVS